MTVTNVLTILGVKIPFIQWLKIADSKLSEKFKNFDEDDVFEVDFDIFRQVTFKHKNNAFNCNDEKEYLEKSKGKISAYSLHHDIYEEDESHQEVVVGFCVLFRVWSNMDDMKESIRNYDHNAVVSDYNVTRIDFEETIQLQKKLKEWMNENSLTGNVELFTVTDDCHCCS